MKTFISRRTLLFISGMILSLALASVNLAAKPGAEGRKDFVGLWQAIDTFDGSTQFLSITCDRDNSCDVRLNDTTFTLSCQNQIGVARGVGSIVGDTLTVTFTLSCSNLNGTSSVVGTQLNEFVLDRKNGILTNINDDPVPVPNVFHKISE